MSASEFDDLLGDFGNGSTITTTTTTTTTKTSSFDDIGDDFDPFRPSQTSVQASHGENFGLLLDLSPDDEIKNGENPGGSNSSSPSTNPFYNMSKEDQSSNPLYDLASPNLLYEFSTDGDTNESSSTIYKFSSESKVKSSPSNPLYDLETDYTTNEAAEEADLLSGTNEQQEEDDDDRHSSHSNNDFDDSHGDSEAQQEDVVEHEVLTVEYEPRVLNGAAKHWVGQHDEDLEESQPQQESDDGDDDDYSGHVHVVEEEEEVIDGGRTVSRITRIETRRSGPDVEQTQSSVDFSNKQWEEEKNRQNVDLSRHSGGQGHVSVYEVTYSKSEPTPAPRKHFESQKEVHAAEAGVYESQPQSFQQWQNEEEEEGVYENQPAKRDDVYREADSDKTADLPARGTAQSMRAKFMSAQQESTTWSKHEISPSDFGAGGEYVSEPRSHIERYEGRAESGVFESEPVVIPGVVTASSVTEEATYESGFARNTAAKFRELQKRSSISSTHREVSPDRSGPGEYVSEPRGHVEIYEGKAESGVFESEPVVNPDVVRSGEEVQDQLPEKGMARNLASKFLQFSSENKSSSSGGSRSKKDTVAAEYSAQAEYVSEPRSQHTSDYVAKVDAGVFENQPQRSADVVTSDSVPEDYIPERGFARNVAAKFRELESSMKSPPQSPGRRKEFTPPREDDRFHQAAVAENRPEYKPDIIHSADQQEETLPEVGMARNIAQRFLQMEFENKGSQPSGTRAQKEFTPAPRDSGVYENQPKQFYADYNRPAESGVIENEPVRRDDVVRGDEPPRYEEELPERGAAKNLVNRWRQMEAEGAKLKSPGSSGRPKEFTPPREEPRLSQQRKTPHSPASPTSHGRLDNGAVHPYDLPGQYQPQNEASVSESSPQQRSDVVREADTDWSDGMPLKDTAKKMLARFQSLEVEAGKQQQASVPRRDSQNSETEYYHTMENTKQNVEDENKVGRSKSMRAAVQMEKCGACEKTVYAMERLEMNKRVYHKACFRCTQCKAVLTPKTFAINNEVIFCTTHYKQLFATKGNYDEGFGRIQHKKRWNSNPNLAKDAEEDGKS